MEKQFMYTAKDIRNIALLGHGGDGKSALCESMLFNTKAITRLGKRADLCQDAGASFEV